MPDTTQNLLERLADATHTLELIAARNGDLRTSGFQLAKIAGDSLRDRPSSRFYKAAAETLANGGAMVIGQTRDGGLCIPKGWALCTACGGSGRRPSLTATSGPRCGVCGGEGVLPEAEAAKRPGYRMPYTNPAHVGEAS